jgi:hypothetical protein
MKELWLGRWKTYEQELAPLIAQLRASGSTFLEE